MTGAIKGEKSCPWATRHGERICEDGYLWDLTYSEMGPPDSRQIHGPCPFCNGKTKEQEQ